jgi:hypothetical protein
MLGGSSLETASFFLRLTRLSAAPVVFLRAALLLGAATPVPATMGYR